MDETAPRADVHSPGKLRWRCRRGMKELDVLLTRYLDERLPGAPIAEQEAFWRLLDSQDTTLYAYFMGTERPQSADIAALVERIAAAPR